jgi:hypothetical protein
MDVLIRGRKAGLPPIALKKAGVETVRGLGVAVVEFENVAGRLRSGDRPSGDTRGRTLAIDSAEKLKFDPDANTSLVNFNFTVYAKFEV